MRAHTHRRYDSMIFTHIWMIFNISLNDNALPFYSFHVEVFYLYTCFIGLSI